MPEQWTSSLTAKSGRFKEKLWTLDSHVGGEIGVKTVVYNAPKKKKKRGEKGWRTTTVKKKEFCTLDHTIRAWPRILFVFVHVQLFSFNTIFQSLFPRFRLAFFPTLYKFIVRAFWAWVHSYFGFKPKLVLTIGAVCGDSLILSGRDFGLVLEMEESSLHQPTIGPHQGTDNPH